MLLDPNSKTIEEEKGHSTMHKLIVCPFEAKTAIAEVAIAALDAMLKEGLCGYPCGIIPGTDAMDDVDEALSNKAHEVWERKVVAMRQAFALALVDEMDRDKADNKAIEDGLLEFATWFEHLWI